MADTPNYLWTLLEHVDPEVRVIAYSRIYDMTDESVDTGDSFWRDQENHEERENAIKEWKQAVDR